MKGRKKDPPIPPRVRSLVGARFGRLVVQFFAGMDKHHKSYWCCLCDCGAVCRVPGARLLGTGRRNEQKSCGCLRADPGIRKAARLKVPAKRRREICDKMRAAVRHRRSPYSMDAHLAAEMLGCDVERVRALTHDGVLGFIVRNGALYVSSRDVAALLGERERQKKRCLVRREWEMDQMRKEASQ